jgi:hypothetical protein
VPDVSRCTILQSVATAARPRPGACWGSRSVWELHATCYRVCRAGASIAIDDRFEVWDSGYISVPFDFEVWLQGCKDLGFTL